MSRPLAPPAAPPELPAAPTLVGRTLSGRYRIVEKVGEGGMGTVFVAEQLRLNRRVAVKVLPAQLIADPESIERFRREADAMSRLQHPHVVSILDFDVAEDGAPYLVMELLTGETLAQRMERDGALDAREALRIVTGIADALGAAHDAGVVHRDLKPQNVFLVRAGEGRDFVKLLDFGISKQVTKTGPRITVANALVGSPLYMAPEQVLDDDALVGFGTDQYALGIIAYELLTGTKPFDGDNVWRLLMSTVNDPPPPFAERRGLPIAVERAVHSALAKHPRDRFRTVFDFAAALGAAFDPESARARTIVVPNTEPPPDAAPKPGETASSENVTRTIVATIDEARTAIGEGRVLSAWQHAERALTMTERTEDPAAAALLRLSEELLTRIFTARIGGLKGTLQVVRAPTPGDVKLTPLVVFVLSRLDGQLAVSDLLDVSPLPFVDTLRALARLVDAGILAPR